MNVQNCRTGARTGGWLSLQRHEKKPGRRAFCFLAAGLLTAGVMGISPAECLASETDVIYSQPGADFGKGHVYSFPPAFRLSGDLTPVPDRFSWADLGKKPTVRSQGKLGTCWAISAASAIESALLPDRQLVFSPDHISLQNGFDISQDEGGDYSMIMSYMADFKGPVLESEDPYGDGSSPSGLRSAVHVEEMRLLKGMSGEQIRRMIYRFGPVQSSLCMDRARTDLSSYSYYNKDTYGYYDPFAETLNHDILILGWDVNFSRENFALQPQHDGAWICQNTWGEDFGDNGIFYVSFDDANLFSKGGIAYTDVEPADDYDNVMEQDRLGWQARQGYDAESAYFAGVFEADRDQTLEAAGLYATGPSTMYRLQLVPEYTGAGDLTREGESLGFGWLENAGWYTLKTDRPVQLSAGQKFAVIVWIDTPDQEKPVAVETCKDKFTSTVTLDGKETYISPDGQTWERTQTVYGTNVCLKLFTRYD